jgi:hypothetical protein
VITLGKMGDHNSFCLKTIISYLSKSNNHNFHTSEVDFTLKLDKLFLTEVKGEAPFCTGKAY